jgi:MYXO-CTERM domain-containing protein
MRKARKRTPRKVSVGKRLGPTGKILISGAVLGAGMGLGAGQPAEAATFQVTNSNDSGPGSLRQAILDANAAAGADVITFQAGLPSPILLTSGQLSVTDSVDIQGPDDALLTVSGNDSSRVFYLYSPTSLDVTISGLTIADGNVAAAGAGILARNAGLVLDGVTITGNDVTTLAQGGGLSFQEGQDLTIRDSILSANSALYLGGGISITQAYTVVIERSTISGNQATAGGGLSITDPDGGMLTIRDTTISGNDATDGSSGGLLVSAPGERLTVENCTISGNTAASNGGGIGLFSFYDAQFRHTTIAGNSAAGSGGGLFNSGSWNMANSIVADNTAQSNPDVTTSTIGGAVNLSYSLIENPGTANINDNGGNILNQDPQLGPLTSNGGPTETHKPATTSPVVNAGDPSFAPPPATDQRGFSRVSGSGLDMGAVELGAGTLQFSLAAYSVNEEGGTATITVNRVGGGDGAVSVSYATSDGTATQGDDYAPAAGMLSWADGDTAAKTFQVAILDDALFEGDETVNLALSNPQGAALGSPSTAVLTIADGEEPPAPPSEIPALGGVGKLLLAGLFGLGGSLLLRRRRSPDRPFSPP